MEENEETVLDGSETYYVIHRKEMWAAVVVTVDDVDQPHSWVLREFTTRSKAMEFVESHISRHDAERDVVYREGRWDYV